jgi:hypothetical protein
MLARHSSNSRKNAAIAAYVRWHNARAHPKSNFAPDSVSRGRTDYPARAT